jgi:putative spermidine/putrescine transport system ATP-binding protein
MSRTLVELRGVAKRYGAVSAVDALSLEIYEGEFLTVLGPSGSGKTTALMLIAGFEDISTGEILVRGRSVAGLPPEKRDIGMVFQNYALFPHLRVFDNVAFPLRMRGTGRHEIARRVGATLDAVHLTGLEDRLPRQLSGGQQQRVALARALVYRPSLLLMDEPLAALDKKLREEMQGELKAIQRDLDVTTMYVTHDQQEALALSDRIAIMRSGRLVQVGAPIDLYDRPVDRFTAEFLGEANILEGDVTVARDGVVCVRVAGTVDVTAEVRTAVAVGQRVGLMVRPESIQMRDRTDGGVDAWAGIVKDVVFLGDVVRCTVEIAPLVALRLVLPYRKDEAAVKVGQAITVAAPPSRWTVFPSQ